jgi:hypothetical protein
MTHEVPPASNHCNSNDSQNDQSAVPSPPGTALPPAAPKPSPPSSSPVDSPKPPPSTVADAVASHQEPLVPEMSPTPLLDEFFETFAGGFLIRTVFIDFLTRLSPLFRPARGRTDTYVCMLVLCCIVVWHPFWWFRLVVLVQLMWPVHAYCIATYVNLSEEEQMELRVNYWSNEL